MLLSVRCYLIARLGLRRVGLIRGLHRLFVLVVSRLSCGIVGESDQLLKAERVRVAAPAVGILRGGDFRLANTGQSVDGGDPLASFDIGHLGRDGLLHGLHTLLELLVFLLGALERRLKRLGVAHVDIAGRVDLIGDFVNAGVAIAHEAKQTRRNGRHAGELGHDFENVEQVRNRLLTLRFEVLAGGDPDAVIALDDVVPLALRRELAASFVLRVGAEFLIDVGNFVAVVGLDDRPNAFRIVDGSEDLGGLIVRQAYRPVQRVLPVQCADIRLSLKRANRGTALRLLSGR